MLVHYGPASPARAWEQDPYRYPGPRPEVSFVVTNEGVHRVGGRRSVSDIDGSVDIKGRHAVLAYGSNADPSKLSERLAWPGSEPVVVLRARVAEWGAAWATGRRYIDSSPVVVLLPRPGHTAATHVALLTNEQLDVMDGWEGHPDRYCRTSITAEIEYFDVGAVHDAVSNGSDSLWAYLGSCPQREPLRGPGGHPYWLADYDVEQIDPLVAQ